MKFTIRALVLWPKVEGFEPRTLHFLPDRINLISGLSRTGKSAITYIIDYVLGSGKCAIPVGEIRETVSWYGLVVDIGDWQMLIAREDPGAQAASDGYFLDERAEVSVPRRPAKNTNRAAVKARLDTLAGLPNVDMDAEHTGSGYLGRPSFRDMAAFNFLPQHIVANPYTLFFKADTTEHRQKLRSIVPFVLGAVTVSHLVAEHEMAELERRLRRLLAELKQRERTADLWKSEALGLHSRAVELGLLVAETPKPQSLTEAIRALATLPRVVSTAAHLPARIPGATLAASRRLDDIRRREHEVDRALGSIRTRLQRVRGLREAVSDFAGTAAGQVERVHGVGWLQAQFAATAPCPACGADSEAASLQLKQLSEAAEELAARQRLAGEAPIALQKEEQALLGDLQREEESLRGLRTERAALEEERSKAGGLSLEDVYRFVGRVEEALRNLQHTQEGSSLKSEIAALQDREKELRATLDPAARQRRLNAAKQLFSRRVAHYAKSLGLERADDAIDLDVSELTLVFTSRAGKRRDFLWEIGSGANWMGYHIATMLALQEFFLARDPVENPVPSFLVIDQPSQVYFPSGWERPQGADDVAPRDIQETRRVFTALSEGLSNSKGKLQFIVTEHVDANTLGAIPGLHVVADWHGEEDDFLIPKAWLS